MSQLDAFFTDLATTQGPQSRKTVRTVVSLILRVAVPQEAIRDNPVRHLDPIEAGSRKPWALTATERRRFLKWMRGISEDEEEARAQASARRRDLPDFVTFSSAPACASARHSEFASATSTSKACRL